MTSLFVQAAVDKARAGETAAVAEKEEQVVPALRTEKLWGVKCFPRGARIFFAAADKVRAAEISAAAETEERRETGTYLDAWLRDMCGIVDAKERAEVVDLFADPRYTFTPFCYVLLFGISYLQEISGFPGSRLCPALVCAPQKSLLRQMRLKGWTPKRFLQVQGGLHADALRAEAFRPRHDPGPPLARHAQTRQVRVGRGASPRVSPKP